jgi:hypothetical protein
MSQKQYPSDKQDKFMLRLPDGMRALLKDLAKNNARSLNAEIVKRLEDSLSTQDVNYEGIDVPDFSQLPESSKNKIRQYIQDICRLEVLNQNAQ